MWPFLHKIIVLAAQYRFLNKKFCVLNYLLLLSSWIIYKNECIISYFYKEKNYKNYKLGDNPHDVSDIELNNNYMTVFFFDALKVLIAPYLFYKITNSIKGMLIYQCIIFLSVLDKDYSNYFFKTKFRYILLVGICYLMTNYNIINDNYMKIVVKYGVLISFLLILYTHYFYKDKIEDIEEISFVGIIQLVYILSKFIKN